MEHLVIRKGKWERYDAAVWDKPRQLPIGLAALLASAGSFALIWAVSISFSVLQGFGADVPYSWVKVMDQVWWVGPIAKTTGDIGFEVRSSCYLPA